jgi:hypothetical protein
MRWPPEVVRRALELRDAGLSSYEIGRILGVPRASVANWCSGRSRVTPDGIIDGLGRDRCATCRGLKHEAFPPAPYAYLFGLYLGDGFLTLPGRQVWLCFAMDLKYPGIMAECRRAISAVLPFRRSNVRKDPRCECVHVRSYGREWLCLFPQHGHGRKHHRKIKLAPWQREIVAEHTGPFLRGLIHSDGWRGLNRVHVKGRGLRLSALPVLQPLRRHPPNLHRRVRLARHRVAPLGSLAHLGRQAGVGRETG